MQINRPPVWRPRVSLAERGGFEPPIGYEPIHAFQACDLNHSSISPASCSAALLFGEAADYSKFLCCRIDHLRCRISLGSDAEPRIISPIPAFRSGFVPNSPFFLKKFKNFFRLHYVLVNLNRLPA